MPDTQIEKENGVAIVWLDQPGEKVNTISLDLVDTFTTILNNLEDDETVKGVVLISRKPDNFIAGADIEKFKDMKSPEEAEMLSRQGHVLLNRMAAFPKPIVAALHGATLGGGLEVALACHYRIASDDPKTVLALPEVKLGLLPGGGGTQRLPRLIGLQAALDMMLTGKNIYPQQAKKMGLVDDLIHPYGLLQAAKKVALELADHPPERKKRQPFLAKLLESTSFSRNVVYKKAKELVQKQTWGNYPAPFKIIECVQAGMEKGLEAGLEAETKKFGELMVSPQSRELVQIFLSMTALKKNPLKDRVRPVKKIGILGAGLMGSGIANISVTNGMEVLLKDISYEAVGQGEKAIWQDMDGKVKKKALSPFQRDLTLSRITGTVDYRDFERADLIIEAVFEDLDIKRSILAETEAVTREDAIFASNTSSLPIGSIAAAAKRPEQVIGMHYFSPVPRMPLLEIIVTEKTADWVRATALDVGIRQGKTVIVVNDGPGFYTTRILAPLLNEALELLDEGGDIKEIDRAMRQFGYPVGPIALLDEVGIDVGAHVSNVLSPLFIARGGTPNTAMARLFAAGYKGRKNNRGFYLYGNPASRKKKEVNEEIYSFFGGPKRRKFDLPMIQNRLSLVMVNEAALCLQEGILQSPRDGDIGAVFGLGFPPFLGGPFRFIDSLGLPKILSLLEKLERQCGQRFTPAQILRDREAKNQHFYA
ncbi:MAG: fatty acid oxidation complex subunit alpha FadJ [Deltaproteobacteria bacterium]|nr:fatty acid oxidation complex subunit alpha FadJ [Deltaproteobacteria bacterium]